MTHRWNSALLIIGALLVTSPHARSQINSASTVAGGGAVCSANAIYRVNGTLGQSAIGSTRTNATLTHQGFWHALPRAVASLAPDEPTTGTRAMTLQASPNPFSTSTELHLSLPRVEHVTLVLYDLLGQPVRTLPVSAQQVELQTIRLDAEGLPAGSYTAVLTAGNQRRAIPLTLVK